MSTENDKKEPDVNDLSPLEFELAWERLGRSDKSGESMQTFARRLRQRERLGN